MPMSQKRLIFTLGTWQLTLLGAALHQEATGQQTASEDYLVLYGDWLPNQLKRSMMQLAQLLWNWQKIIWADDLLFQLYARNCNLPVIQEVLRQRIEVSEFDEIWVCKLFDPPEKFVCDVYPQANIVLYEDGFGSYFPKERSGAASKLLFSHLRPGVVCDRHLRRLVRTYLLLTRYLPIPEYLQDSPIVRMEREYLLYVIRQIESGLDLSKSISLEEYPDNRVLVLGQALAKFSLMAWGEEWSLYRQVIFQLLESGFTVIWKEHPRVDRFFFPELSQELPSEQFIELSIPHSLPVELVAEQLNLIGCVSITSSSLFYLYELFRIKPHTLANRLRKLYQQINKEASWPSLNLVERIIPKFETLKTTEYTWEVPKNQFPLLINNLTPEELMKGEAEISSPKFMHWLCGAVEQYCREPSNQSLLTDLRRLRQQIATFWMSLPAEQLESFYADYGGKAHQILLKSGIKNELLTETESGFVAEISAQLAKELTGAKSINCLLVAMLYCQSYQLPLQPDLNQIPQWLLSDYLKFVFSSPSSLGDTQQEKQYADHIKCWLDYLNKSIKNQSNRALWRYVAEEFVQIADFTPVYSLKYKAYLKEIFCCRAEMLEKILTIKGYELDYHFDERSSERQKIRLGVLAEHFMPDAETYESLSLYEHLSRKFEVILYCIHGTSHPLQEYCQSCANVFKLLPKDLKEQVNHIRADELDILLIGSNITARVNSVCLLSLHRLARIQISGSASAVTTGMRNVDYYLSTLASDIDSENQYRERLLKLDQATERAEDLFANLLKKREQSIIESRLNLRDANFLVFPDWSQPEEFLGVELANLVRAIATHPDRSQITMLIDTGNATEEDANMMLSGIIMNLLMTEDLEIDEQVEISLLGNLSPIQWEALLSRIQARLVIEHENEAAIARTGAENLPAMKIDSMKRGS